MGDNGFSDNPFMIGYDNRIYEEDKELGFRFPGGKLVGSGSFITLDKIIAEIRPWEDNLGYPVILNIGDSSTSGWNSDRIFKGNEDPNAAFFTYKTYSDLMRENPSYPFVINAGVPGYSSLQGKKYLEQLLKKLSKEGIQVHYVIIYFGNNDCTFNLYEDKVRLEGKIPSVNHKGERVSCEDYQKNLADMIEIIREYGAKPILIAPVAHYDWEPGIRSNVHKQESIDILRNLDNNELKKEIELAKSLYLRGEYKKAHEMDRVLPRIKKAYRKAAHKAARETKTDIIDVQKKIPATNNDEYFADYCHPLERINQMIVDEFIKIRLKDAFREPLKTKIIRNIQEWKEPKIYTIH